MNRQAQQDVFYAVLAGDQEQLNALWEQYQLALEFGAELLEAAGEALDNMDDYEVGRVTGRIAGEIMLEIALAVTTGGAGNVATKSTTMTNVINKLDNLPNTTIPPAVKAKFGELVQHYSKMATSGMCFVAGTPVHTARGLIPIERIQVGDTVLSRDSKTGEQGYKPVLETFITHPDALYHVTYVLASNAAESGPADYNTLTCTGEHPFYVEGIHEFVPASGLCHGAELRLSSGATAYVTDVQVERGPPGHRLTTYNFAVADWHTYFVGGESTGVWVHNADDGCQVAYGITARVERTTGKRGIEKFKEFLDQTNSPGRRKAVEMTMRQVVSEVMKEVYTEAVSLADVPAVQQLKSLKDSATYGPRLVNKDLAIHHTTPKYLLRRLIQMQNPDWTWDEVLQHADSIADNMPGMLMHQKDHVGSDAEGLASFHRRLTQDAKLPPPPAGSGGQVEFTRGQILDGLRKAYEDSGHGEV